MKPLLLAVLIFLLLINVGICSSAQILNEENLPPEFEAIYDVHKKGLHVGEMKVRLIKQGNQIIYESVTKPVGIASIFLGKQEIKALAELEEFNGQYRAIEYKRQDTDKKRNEHYIFHWKNRSATVAYKDINTELSIPENTFDNYSMQLLLMREPIPGVTKNSYSVISKGRLKEYIYTLEAQELIETKLGDVDTFKLVRKKDNEKNTTYFGWYADSLHYLPVKLDKYENGKIDLSIQISKIRWL